jgi:hypothetical protein
MIFFVGNYCWRISKVALVILHNVARAKSIIFLRNRGEGRIKPERDVAVVLT